MGRCAPPLSLHGGGAHGVAQRPVFSMPQNTVAGAATMPTTFFLEATGPYHCPSHTCVGYCVSRTCTASAIGLSLAGLVSRAYWSRSDSSSLSQGQPNMAVSHEALMKPAPIGFRMSAATHEVRKACQPPWAGGSFLARRATRVCQSIDCMSTLKPAFSMRFFATGAKLVRTARSVECIRTMGVPSYPPSLRRALAFSKLESRKPSMPLKDSFGDPHGKRALHTL